MTQFGLEPIKPTVIKVKRGRPKKVRRKGLDEDENFFTNEGVNIISNKENMVMTCKKCGKIGHNRRTCGRRSG